MITNNKKNKKLLLAASNVAAAPFSYSYNDVLYIGPRFYTNNHGFITYAEFQNSGYDLLIQTYAGEATLSLSTAYVVSTGVSYKSGTATWVDADKYSDASYSALASSYNRLARIDTTAGKAYQYKIDGTTQVYSGLNSYTSTSLTTDSSSSNPFGGSTPSMYSSASNVYVQKSDGGIAILQATVSTDIIYLRNYANNTTSTVSSYSTLDISSFPISSIFLAAMSLDGTKVSIYYRNSSNQYDIQTWTLSSAFDLSTAGSPTGSLNVGNGFVVEGGWVNRDPNHSYLVVWNQYGDIDVFTWTTDGDISTFTKFSDGNRSNLGFYRSCCSSIAYFDEGNYVLNYGYSGSATYVFGPLSTPYDWTWEDGGFTPRGGTSIRWGYYSDTGSVPPQDGQMDANRNYLYAGFYSSTYRVYKQNFGTAGDPKTITTTGYEYLDFTGWTGSYGGFSLWVDTSANKLHMADGSNASGTYFIFDLDVDGGFSGTYSTTPTGFTPGDFQSKYHIQPLSSDGTIFIYYQSGLIKVVELNTAFHPAQGWTELGSFLPHYELPNGSTRAISSPDIYVQDHIIFATQNTSNKTAKIDVLINGVAPT
jgi:hypothetical protein